MQEEEADEEEVEGEGEGALLPAVNFNANSDFNLHFFDTPEDSSTQGAYSEANSLDSEQEEEQEEQEQHHRELQDCLSAIEADPLQLLQCDDFYRTAAPVESVAGSLGHLEQQLNHPQQHQQQQQQQQQQGQHPGQQQHHQLNCTLSNGGGALYTISSVHQFGPASNHNNSSSSPSSSGAHSSPDSGCSSASSSGSTGSCGSSSASSTHAVSSSSSSSCSEHFARGPGTVVNVSGHTSSSAVSSSNNNNASSSSNSNTSNIPAATSSSVAHLNKGTWYVQLATLTLPRCRLLCGPLLSLLEIMFNKFAFIA